MIAEYEQAQIAERSSRGKRHRAQQGVVNVLSGAPFGYQYVKKSETSAAYYEVIEHENVVRRVFAMYTQQGLSINAIAHSLSQQRIPPEPRTRGGSDRPSGGCYATRHTRARPVMARQNCGLASASRDHCGSATDCRIAIAPIMSVRARNGSR